MRGWEHAKGVRKTANRMGSVGNPVPGNIPRVLDELGIEYRERGEECQGLCPSPDHDDTSPSWSVNTDTGVHNCFSCGFKGSFVHLVVSVTTWSWEDAAQFCRQRGGVEKAISFLEKRNSSSQKTAQPRREAELARFEDPPLDALAKRLLSLDACQELGVLWDVEREMWITPIRDPKTNKLLGWQEKNARLFRNFPANVPKSTTLFGYDRYKLDDAAHTLGDVRRIILVESPLDVVRLRSVGIRGGVASYGVQVSQRQLSIIASSSADELVLALDNDDAGISKSKELRKSFRVLPVRFFNYQGSTAKDIGELGASAILDGVRTSISHILPRN